MIAREIVVISNLYKLREPMLCFSIVLSVKSVYWAADSCLLRIWMS